MNKDLFYVCSPLSASTQEGIRINMMKAREYMRMVSEKYNCRAIAPHAILPVYLDDHIPEERALGQRFGLDLLRICKKIVVCGDRISNGMQQEIELARSLGIEIIYQLDMPKKTKLTVTLEIEGE